MRPAGAPNDVLDSPPVNGILPRQCALAYTVGMGGADGEDLPLRQLGLWVTLAAHPAATGAALCDHIGNVVFGRSEEQVIRTDTARIVALMAYVQFGGKRPVMKLPRKAMSTDYLTVPAPGLNDAIAAIRLCARPQPTRISLLDATPKAVNEGCNFMWHVTMITQNTLRDKWRIAYGAG
jgi:hypothetical protein